MHFLGKRQKYRKYYLQRKNYKENVENISMNTSGKIKKRENISWIDTFPLLPLKTEQRPKMWKT